MSKSLVAATSAALAACASTLVVYPLDTLLVHHQASASKQPRKLLQQQHKQHRSLIQALVDVLHELLHQEENSSRFRANQKQQPNKDRLAEFLNGIGRLYSGLGVKLAEQVARNFVYFYLDSCCCCYCSATAATATAPTVAVAVQQRQQHLLLLLVLVCNSSSCFTLLLLPLCGITAAAGQAMDLVAVPARSYQALKSRAAKSQVTMTTVNTLLLAVLAAFGTQLLTAPLDVTSTHAQLCRLPLRTIFMRILRTEVMAASPHQLRGCYPTCSSQQHSLPAACAFAVRAYTGPLGFYRGFGASLCLCVNPAITNATFDSLNSSSNSNNSSSSTTSNSKSSNDSNNMSSNSNSNHMSSNSEPAPAPTPKAAAAIAAAATPKAAAAIAAAAATLEQGGNSSSSRAG
ncbi:hypothetical protein ACSSS7_002242 [Eimeria intestinalis]